MPGTSEIKSGGNIALNPAAEFLIMLSTSNSEPNHKVQVNQHVSDTSEELEKGGD